MCLEYNGITRARVPKLVNYLLKLESVNFMIGRAHGARKGTSYS